MIRRYLMDTGIAQDFRDNHANVRARAKAARALGHRVGICIPVLGELWSGVEGSAQRNANEVLLLRALSQLSIWPYSIEAAAEYGRIFTQLKRAGTPIQQIDIQIGAIARTLPNCVVVSKDSDLLVIPGLPVENWAS